MDKQAKSNHKPPICDCCGNTAHPGERRVRCRIQGCNHMFNICCRGDINPAVCTCCYVEQTSYGTSRPRNYHDNGVIDFGRDQ